MEESLIMLESLRTRISLRTRVLIVIFVGAILIAIDAATVSPILESIQQFYGVNESVITWILNIEVLTLMLATPIMANLSDRYGRRNIYVLNAALFLVGLLIVVFSTSYSMLLVGRAIEGIGAVLSVLAIILIGDYFKERRGIVLGVYGVIIAVVYAVGPLIAGFLVTYSWKWIFIINIPVAAITVLLGFFLLPTGKVAERFGRFDWKGMIVLGIGIGAIALFIFNLSSMNPLSSTQWLTLAVSIIALIVFGWMERKVVEPILPVKLLSKRNTLIASVVIFVGYLAEAFTYYLSTYASTAFTLSYSMAAYIILPFTVSSLVTTLVVGRLLDLIGPKPIMVIGGALMTVGVLILSYSTNIYIFVFGLLVVGVGNVSIAGNALYYIFLDETGKSNRATGQALLNILLNAGSLLGAAIIGTAITDLSAYGAVSFRTVFLYTAVVYFALTILSLGLISTKAKKAVVSG